MSLKHKEYQKGCANHIAVRLSIDTEKRVRQVAKNRNESLSLFISNCVESWLDELPQYKACVDQQKLNVFRQQDHKFNQYRELH